MRVACFLAINLTASGGLFAGIGGTAVELPGVACCAVRVLKKSTFRQKP